MEGASTKVTLYVYDLSDGLAASLSPSLLGRQIDGIWHTSIVVHQTEFYFGGGISTARPGTTAFGRPVQRIELGETHLPMEVIHDLVNDLRHRFSETTYNLLSNNCNNFTNELAKLLIGTGIPDHIVNLPDEVMSTPFGQMIKPMLAGLEGQLGSVNERQSQPPPIPSQPTPAPAATPSTASSSSHSTNTGLQSDVEILIRREFAALVAEGGVTPNQAAILALERVRAIYGKGRNDKGQA